MITAKKAKKKVEEQPMAEPRSIVDQEGRVINKLPKEVYLEMRLNQMELDKVKQEMTVLQVQMESIDKSKLLATLQRDDLRNRIHRLEARNKSFLKECEAKVGIRLEGRIINPETLEIVE